MSEIRVPARSGVGPLLGHIHLLVSSHGRGGWGAPWGYVCSKDTYPIHEGSTILT